MGPDLSKGGPCPDNCPLCVEQDNVEHDMTAAEHTGIAPDGIMDLCPRCALEDPKAYHYTGDWHRRLLSMEP